MKNSVDPPIYSQVAYDIAAKIASGEIGEKNRFSGRSLMGSQYAVSSETIRRALRLLDDMGIVTVRQNVGAVVLSKQRAVEYVEQYKAGNDLRALKCQLRALVAQRDALNETIMRTVNRITDLGDRFWRSDLLRTYEFPLTSASRVVGHSIGTLQFRQSTGATIVAVRRQGDILLSPGPQTVLLADDILVIACDITGVEQVSTFIG